MESKLTKELKDHDKIKNYDKNYKDLVYFSNVGTNDRFVRNELVCP